MRATDPHILPRTLHGRDPLLAAEAARLIGERGLKVFVPDLIKNLRTSRFYCKVASLYALDRLAPSEPLLLEIFENPNVPDDFYWIGFKSVKTAAAISLMKIGNSEGEGWLRRLAETSDPVLLRWFAPAMLRLPASSPVAELLALDILISPDLRDAGTDTQYTDPGQVCLLCEALGLIQNSKATEHLEHFANFHSRFVRGQAYRSLNQQKPDATTAAKIAELARHHGTDYDRLVFAAIDGDVTTLKKIAATAPMGFDRASAIEALPWSEQDVHVFIQSLDDPDPYVRQCAVERLGDLDFPAATEALDLLAERETMPRVLCALASVFATRGEAVC